MARSSWGMGDFGYDTYLKKISGSMKLIINQQSAINHQPSTISYEP